MANAFLGQGSNYVGFGSGASDASEVAYDNTTSGLTSTNVQDAIDEVNGKIPTNGLKLLPVTNTSIFTIADNLAVGFYPITCSAAIGTPSSYDYSPGIILKRRNDMITIVLFYPFVDSSSNQNRMAVATRYGETWSSWRII